MTDRFGITKLYPDARAPWEANWDDGHARSVAPQHRDPLDPLLIMRGDGTLSIDGVGVAKLSGAIPRIYVYDPSTRASQKWQNVEVTFYGMRVHETGGGEAQGFVVGARSEHQDASDEHPCPGTVYYGRLLYDGRAHFKKELRHGNYSHNMPNNRKIEWPTRDGQIPSGVWVGFKYVVRNIDDDSKVSLSLYRDQTDGVNGGTWERVAEYVDDGGWPVIDDPADCGYSQNRILTEPATSVFIRNDNIDDTRYKYFSIREIAVG